MGKVAAIFVDPRGPYPRKLGADMCWTKDRDARQYTESYPVVAHPPCQVWTNMAYVNYKRWGGDHNRPGNDAGCFKLALDTTRRCGGVLEHPAFSRAWAAYGLWFPYPGKWLQMSDPTEWVCEVWQSAYGHKCRKRTWLFYKSRLPEFKPYDANWERPKGSHQIGYHDQRGKDRNKPTVSKREASESPVQFAEWLICLAHRAAYGR